MEFLYLLGIVIVFVLFIVLLLIMSGQFDVQIMEKQVTVRVRDLTGPTGPTGVKGIDGASGPAGQTGQQGLVGPTGGLGGLGGTGPTGPSNSSTGTTATPGNVFYVNQVQTGPYTPNGSVLAPFVHIMDAVNQIIANNNSTISYLIWVAPGQYPEDITLNSLAIGNIAFVAQSGTSGSNANDALDLTTITGNITSTSNNTNIHGMIFQGFDLTGNINLTGDTAGTSFGIYGIMFSQVTLYTNAAVGLNLQNVGQVIFDDCGTAIQSGASAVNVQNVAFFGIYHTFFNLGPMSITTNAGANKPSGFGATSVQVAFGNALDTPLTIDAGSTLTLRYSRLPNTLNNSGTLTSVNCVFQSVVTNSGTWNSNADAFNATFVNTGTMNNNSTLYSTFHYTPAVPANWVVVPTTVQQALDRLAAKVGPV